VLFCVIEREASLAARRLHADPRRAHVNMHHDKVLAHIPFTWFGEF
jgi:hypothetical protein